MQRRLPSVGRGVPHGRRSPIYAPAASSRDSPNYVRALAADATTKSFEEFYDGLSPPRRKLFGILNDYRRANFEKTMPSRFVRDVLLAADAVESKDGVITASELRGLLRNIDAQDEMTDDELEEIFEEVGVDGGDGRGKVLVVEDIEEEWAPYIRAIASKRDQ